MLQFTLPVAINFGAMDSNLLTRFWASRGGAERETAPPELADRCLIFYRGVDMVSQGCGGEPRRAMQCGVLLLLG